MEQVEYGNTQLEFELDRSGRKSLAIEVHPDLSIYVKAPIDSSLDDIKERVIKKGKWIAKQKIYFEQFLPRTPEREYVSGETHLYLGKRYVLKLRKSDRKSVKLKGGQLIVTGPKQDPLSIKSELSSWYYTKAKTRFRESIISNVIKFKKFGTEQPPLVVKRMSKRWGSCTPNGRIVLNPEIIKTPGRCIDYVVIHELCHLIHPNHSKDFYDIQTEMMPDWERWKLKLEKTLI
ncbi:SprT family zinc-dependent metalloprotease [Ekhidna sp.]|uniref:M48 family metallopeptidase n=1 Tax=Ekhidna sp. TaxID=2608089 RepID=UPI0032EE93EE